MPRFKVGDRVQLVGDIARFYACIVGVIVKGGVYPAAVLNQYNVRLADGTVAAFFDFQLQTPPDATAHVIFDSSLASKSSGTRGASAVRQVRFLARDVDIHLKISGSGKKTVVGQVSVGATAVRNGLVTLLAGDETVDSAVSDDSGEFTLRDVAAGKITMEIFIPSRRIIATLDV
jgi:hypothetical protein